jgi:hypothetical protein
MSALTACYTILFPEGFDAQSEYETPFRGYLSDVVVQLANGSRYQMFFIDPVQLGQELGEDSQGGRPNFAEPNLIVLPDVTTASIRQAVEGLVKERFFDLLKPL